MSYPTNAPRTRIPFPEQFRDAVGAVFGIFTGRRLIETPIYTHNDFRCLPFVGIQLTDGEEETHMCLPSGAENLPGIFFHELGHLAHWGWFPAETLSAYKHFPDRLEVVAYYFVNRLVDRTGNAQAEEYLKTREMGYLGLKEQQNARIARIIHRAFKGRMGPRFVVEDILTENVDIEDIEAWA